MPDTRTASANLFMYVWSDEQLATDHQVRRFIDAIAMPVQRSILESSRSRGRRIQQTRALIIHHRSHEVARTLQTLQQLGFRSIVHRHSIRRHRLGLYHDA